MDPALTRQITIATDRFRLCRLGLATRGNSGLRAHDIHFAIDRGVNFLNWCGQSDGMSRAIADLGVRRHEVLVCVQFEARRAADAEPELTRILTELHCDNIDVLTFYYVEELAEWEEIDGAGGALEFARRAKEQGKVRWIGLTTHQRSLAAQIAASGLLDVLMLRYNAAHRGAENEVFPITQRFGLPVIAFTGLRWGALLKPTPDDPPGFHVPPAAAWYRFVLQHPAVAVALMAPNSRAELEEDLGILHSPLTLAPKEYEALAAHGQRVRLNAGQFP